jgi:hypothetical protein
MEIAVWRRLMGNSFAGFLKIMDRNWSELMGVNIFTRRPVSYHEFLFMAKQHWKKVYSFIWWKPPNFRNHKSNSLAWIIHKHISNQPPNFHPIKNISLDYGIFFDSIEQLLAKRLPHLLYYPKKNNTFSCLRFSIHLPGKILNAKIPTPWLHKTKNW